MQVDLEGLLQLQERDKDIAAVESRLKTLEPELEKLDAVLAEAEEQLAEARTRAIEADKRRVELERRIESYRVMQERRRQRLEWVRGAKEASTIMAELDLARSVLAKEEAEWMRSADLLQEAEDRVTAAEARIREVREVQAPAREASAAKGAEYNVALQAAVATRQQATKTIDSKVLELYERIRRGRAPFALYPLRAGACGHCFTSVPLHIRQQIEAGEVVEACEACGVLVYRDSRE